MPKAEMTDPCLTCPLPDCDDGSPECPLLSAWRSVNHKRKRGLTASAAEVAAAREWYNAIYYPEHRAQRSERNAA